MEELGVQMLIVVIPIFVTFFRKISKDIINPKYLPVLLPLFSAVIAGVNSVAGTSFSPTDFSTKALSGAFIGWASIGIHQTFRKLKKK